MSSPFQRRSLRAVVVSAGLGLVAAPLAMVPAAQADEHIEQVQILATNDFHGRLVNNAPTSASNPGGPEAGAAVLAGAVNQLRGDYPNTVFAAAGDLIGATTFDSFIANDKPTIDALNEAGLEVSAVGNHEFDQGWDDLLNRVMAPYHPEDNPTGGAEWEYIGANVSKPTAPASEVLEPSWVQDFGDVQVGFIGAVTEHLDELVSPAGIEGVVIEDIVTATNREAENLKEAGAEIVVLLVHEGAATTGIASATDPASDFGKIVNGVNADVDAIVSGHTHLAYNHAIPVPEWEAQERAVTTRPVVSAGQYGAKLNKLVFDVDTTTGEVAGVAQSVLDLKSRTDAPGGPWEPNYPADQAVADIVAEAVAEASVLGAVEIGEIAQPINRAKLANGTTENRGGESVAGNLVAEVQRWATESETTGSAQIAFMNPGGLRADMVGLGDGDYPRALSYRQAADMQPFANTLVNMRLTGAQIKAVLEEQWQPTGAQRPFLKLGASRGFTYTYDPTRGTGERVTAMWLHGEPIDPAEVFSVTANSFLAAGGDNFGTLAQGTSKRDTGKTDLQGMVDYMAEFTADGPLVADKDQHAVGITFPADAPRFYRPARPVKFDVSSLAFSSPADVKDDQVRLTLGNKVLGTYDVDNTISNDPFDENGKVAVEATLPANLRPGPKTLTLTGLTTGTQAKVDIVTKATLPAMRISARPDTVVAKKTRPRLVVTVTDPAKTITGRVQARRAGEVITSGRLTDGTVRLQLDRFAKPGVKTVRVRYLGNAHIRQVTRLVTIRVTRR